MKQIKTRDHSYTFYSSEYQETYHSISGALEEAFKKFVGPCKIKELAKKGKIRILDICFGLGYNSVAAIYTALKENSDCKIEIIALEKDKKILKKLQEIKLPPKLEFYYRNIKEKLNNDKFELNISNNVYIKIILGDATKTIKTLTKKFDAIFLDPFSLPKNPELWTYEFFKNIKKVIKKDAILATYSCAKKVRENLVRDGFRVKDGPKIGRKAPSTIAYLDNATP